jgi:hypothetical protein
MPEEPTSPELADRARRAVDAISWQRFYFDHDDARKAVGLEE